MTGPKIDSRATVMAEDGRTPIFVGAPWRIVGVGDFNKNGDTDILWHNSSDNGTQIWYMRDRTISSRPPLVAENGTTQMLVSPPWSMVGVGDFDLNGKADILFHNSSSNETQIWFMDGPKIKSRATVMAEDGRTPIFVGAPWRIVGVGDFDKQLGADILFRNGSDGGTQIWFMDGPKIKGRAPLVAENGTTQMFVNAPWSVVGVADFDLDGKADILFHNSSSNETQIWFMDGPKIKSRATVVGEDGKTPIFVGPPWSIVGANSFRRETARMQTPAAAFTPTARSNAQIDNVAGGLRFRTNGELVLKGVLQVPASSVAELKLMKLALHFRTDPRTSLKSVELYNGSARVFNAESDAHGDYTTREITTPKQIANVWLFATPQLVSSQTVIMLHLSFPQGIDSRVPPGEFVLLSVTADFPGKLGP